MNLVKYVISNKNVIHYNLYTGADAIFDVSYKFFSGTAGIQYLLRFIY